MLRRARGLLLRFVRRRALASLVGVALAAPAAWIEWSGRFDAWWIDGLALVVGATGVALLWTGLTGTKPDWSEYQLATWKLQTYKLQDSDRRPLDLDVGQSRR